jgi:hypothetical protein
LQTEEHGERPVGCIVHEFGSPDITDHQCVAGQDEPRLVRSRAIGDEKAYMLGGMTRRMQDIDHDVAEGTPVAVLYRVCRVGNVGSRVQDIFGTRLGGEGTTGGTMIGMDMGIDDELDAHPCLVGNPQIWSDVTHRIDDGACGMSPAAEQV